jgi:hypothetical protein
MTQEQKPKKKKISLMSVLNDPGKAVSEMMEDPDIVAKIPEVLAKCPPEAMKVLACSIAQYLPPTNQVDEVTRATAVNELSDYIKGQVSTMVVDELSEFRKQLAQLATSIKAIQDDLPSQIQAQASAIFKTELETFQKRIESKNKS